MRLKSCDSLNFNQMSKYVHKDDGCLPGKRNSGYGFVVMPILIKLLSGLSYIFASQ